MRIIGALSVAFVSIHLFGFDFLSVPERKTEAVTFRKIEEALDEMLTTSEIPGFSLIVVKGDTSFIKSYGLSDVGNNVPVTATTLFEIGSCSKAFTSLGILKLAKEGLIDMNAPISTYIPWFKVYYKGIPTDITIKQLAHHTSGIPSHTLALIPQSDADNALEETVRMINGIGLNNPPGKKYEYATIGYDLLALIIQTVTGTSFEQYLQSNVFERLGLDNTTIGKPKPGLVMSNGHKIGFFRPRAYNPPPFKGNNAAGYVVSNAEDIEVWLRYQMGIKSSELDNLILESHKRDETVEPHNLDSYAFGWDVSLRGDLEIHHSGLNPNFAAYILFRKSAGLGVAILANSNSRHATVIGRRVMQILANEELRPPVIERNPMDTRFSIICIGLSFFLLALLAYLGFVIVRIYAGKRVYRPLSFRAAVATVAKSFTLFPFLLAIYLLPMTMANFAWNAAVVWAPESFYVMVLLSVITLTSCYVLYIIASIFPDQNRYFGEAPKIILASVFAGLANMLIIVMVTSFIETEIDLVFLLYYFGLSVAVYLVARKVVDTRIVQITWDIIFDLKTLLARRVFSTSYEKFERIDRGEIYATMSGDIETIGVSTRAIVNTTMSVITALGGFLYLSVLAFWETVVIISFIVTLSLVYYFVSRKTARFFDESRNASTVFMRLLNGMMDGFKEITLHWSKRQKYRADLEASIAEHTAKASRAQVAFINAFLTGELFFIGIIGTVSLIIPRVFEDIPSATIMAFIVVLLYLIGPIHSILNVVPEFLRVRVAWRRIRKLIKVIPANLSLKAKADLPSGGVVETFCVKDISYAYETNNGRAGFSLESFSVDLKRGELLFIVGGNGSGKTTLAKLLTGLYSPHSGGIFINDARVETNVLGEYFSAVFNPFHLFKRLYMDVSEKDAEHISKYLKMLRLQEKVEVINNEYSTIDLSGGQRKRLALLQCLIEDKPIFLLDEWTADQDPTYRRLFYTELLPMMKASGKIIIAITHDDNYFYVADKIIDLDMSVGALTKNSPTDTFVNA